jgi:cell division protein ZipA
MQELRLVLIIVGALAISALLLHGLWTSRKEKPAKFGEKPLGKLDDSNRDTEGFDHDGVGSVRIINNAPEKEVAAHTSQRKEPELHFGEKIQADPLMDTPAPVQVIDDMADLPKMSATSEKIEPKFSSDSVVPAPVAMAVEEKPVRVAVEQSIHVEQPIQSEPASVVSDYTEVLNTPISDIPEVSEQEVKPEENQVLEPEPVIANVVPEPEPEPEPEPVLAPSYIALSVHARNGEMLQGAKLFQCLEQHNLIFGENAVYHRHADLAGTEPVLFSATNMVQPGNFPEDGGYNFETPGVSFYLMLPCYGSAASNFNLMLQTVQRIADDLNADVLDHERAMVTPNRIAQYRDKAKLYSQA